MWRSRPRLRKSLGTAEEGCATEQVFVGCVKRTTTRSECCVSRTLRNVRDHWPAALCRVCRVRKPSHAPLLARTTPARHVPRRGTAAAGDRPGDAGRALPAHRLGGHSGYVAVVGQRAAVSRRRLPCSKRGRRRTRPAPSLPAATGPTDEDPDQAETAREEFQAVTDGSLTLGPEEMEPYDRLVVLGEEPVVAAALRQRAK